MLDFFNKNIPNDFKYVFEFKFRKSIKIKYYHHGVFIWKF